MPRTILVHLNVTADDADGRTEDEIGDEILAALERGLGLPEGELASGNDGPVALALVEEV